jgi:hypothetical protein
MNISILADISDVFQSPHPIYGIPMGLCLLIFVLFKAFSSNKTPPNTDSQFQAPYKDTSSFGEHRFTQNGFCKRCGWEKEFLLRTKRTECSKGDNIEEINFDELQPVNRGEEILIKKYRVQFTSDKKPQNYIQKAYGFTLKDEKYYFHKTENKSDFKTFVFAKNVVSIDELF